MNRSVLGIVGGGQLGRMLALAARELGVRTVVLDPTPGGPAAQVADAEIVGSFQDPTMIRTLAARSDYMTFEIESADAQTLSELAAEGKVINPSPQTLAIIKDKLVQKNFLRDAGIPVADFMEVNQENDIEQVISRFGFPFLLKARLGAYDGRGNTVIRSVEDVAPSFKKLGGKNVYAERFVPFVKELAVIAVRGMSGDIRTYPVVETVHQNNICHMVISPAPVSTETTIEAQNLAQRVLSHLKGVGVFGIELFLTASEKILVNEIAPRVHNSGHHTIEAYTTSQFTQHVRAVTGMPLGPIDPRAPAAVMVNILGDRIGPAARGGFHGALQKHSAHPGVLDNVFVHIYGKVETRPERKMGHVTALGDTLEDALASARSVRNTIVI